MRDQRQCTDTHARIHAQRERYHWWLFTHANGMAQKQTNAPRKFPSFWQPCIASRTHTYTQWRAHHEARIHMHTRHRASSEVTSFIRFFLSSLDRNGCLRAFVWVFIAYKVHTAWTLSEHFSSSPSLCSSSSSYSSTYFFVFFVFLWLLFQHGRSICVCIHV